MLQTSAPDPLEKPASGALIGLDFWLTESLWRLGPAWCVLAAAVMAHGLMAHWTRSDLLQLVLLAFLADPVWGAVWRLFVRSGTRWLEAENAAPAAPPLPFAQPGSPAAKLARWLGSHGLAATRRDGILHALPPLMLLAVILALGLGPSALIACAVILLGSAIAVALNPGWQAWFQAGLQIGLPWMLTLNLWNRLEARPMVLLGVLAVILHYAELIWLQPGREARLWAGVGMLGVLGVLIWQRQPAAAAIVALMWLAPFWVAVSKTDRQSAEALKLLRSVQSWWLAGILVGALALMV